MIDLETDTRFDHRLPTQRFREPDALTAHCMRREQYYDWLEPCDPGPQIGARSVHLAYLVHAGDAHRPMMPDEITADRQMDDLSWDDLINIVGDGQPSWAYNPTWTPEPGTVTATATWHDLEVTASFTIE